MSKCVTAAFFYMVFCGILISAQVTTGNISGVVQDSTGALMPGATITVKNLDTGLARTVTTDEGGRYSAPNLSLGNYEVRAEQSGFQTELRRGITLTVGREAVVNITLQVGSVSQMLTVTAEAPLVESTTASMGSLVDDRTVRELPLNGRSYDQLAILQPGVVTLGAGSAGTSFDYGAGKRFSVSGSRSYANSFLLDGTDINDHSGGTPGGAAGNNLGVEGIREFKILTNTANAEYGRASGGIISAVTRSGTNELHGSAFEFLRNSAMDARNFFDQSGVPPFKRNQFGGALGGPIKKDKTFFFGTYEGLRQSLGTTGIGFVPTVQAKQGILPTKVVPGGSVPVNPAMKPFLGLFPDPNGQDFGDGTGEYISSRSVVTNNNYFMLRGDHQLSDKTSLFARYSYDGDSVVDPGYANIGVFKVTQQALRQYATIQASSILSAAVLNSFRVAYNRANQVADNIPNKPLPPEYSFIPGQTFGTIQVGAGTGVRSLAILGTDNGSPRQFVYNLFQWADDVTLVKGRHSAKAGVDIKRMRDNAALNQSQRGVYTFTSMLTLIAGTPSLFEATQVGQNSYRGYRQTMMGAYAQDDFKMTQRLTLNMGLRWEAVTDPTESNGKVSNLLSPLDPTFTVQKTYFTLTKKNFEPRVGLAWQLTGSGNTVLRAGYGIFHDHVLPGIYSTQVSRTPPFSNLLDAVNPPFPSGYLALTQVGVPRLATIAPFVKEPTKNSYSLSLQQQLFKDMLIEVAYVGSESYHLFAAREANTTVVSYVNGQPFYPAGAPRLNPNFGSNRDYIFDSNSNYNGLQVTVRRKSPTGLQYQAFYTFSKAIDIHDAVSGGDTQQEPNVLLDPRDPARDRGLSTFSAKHNFVFTGSYPFPFRFQQKAVDLLLGHWTVNGISTLRSGEPFTARVSFNQSRDGNGNTPDRPSLIAGRSNNPILGTPNKYYDVTAFSLPAPGTYGNLGRNTLIGPGLANLDLSLEKVFKLRESASVQFRAELFNVLNHSNFALPAVTTFIASGAYSGSAGRITATTTQSRQIQLGLKIIF